MVSLSLAGGVFFGQTASATALTSGQLVVIAGTFASGPPTVGPATGSALAGPYGVAVDGSGNVFIADLLNDEIEKVTPAGALSIITGGGGAVATTTGTPARSAWISPYGIWVNAAGTIVYFVDNIHGTVDELTGERCRASSGAAAPHRYRARR